MAASMGSSPGDPRRPAISPRPKGRENSRNTLCRNIGIYGHCRYEHDGCLYSHEVGGSGKTAIGQPLPNSGRLNVDSPSFKPLQPAANGNAVRSTTISPKSINAAPFTPKTNAATLQPPTLNNAAAPQPDWSAPRFQEFVPQNYDAGPVMATQTDPHGSTNILNSYDPYSLATSVGIQNSHHQPQINPYAHDPASLAGAAYYHGASTFAQPAQYHNYAPLGPHRENLLQYQKTAHDFFIPDKLREDLQRKSEATWQSLPNSTLPANVDHFHTLLPLDTNNQRNATTFGYVTWTYKAVSSKDGKCYTLRRLEGYRLTNEKAIHAVRPWKRIDNGSVVTIHEAFTTRDFGDSSLIFVTDYHPNSKTLSDAHLQHNSNQRYPGRQALQPVAESVLWSYVVQIASALRSIHSNNLAARAIIPSKVLITSKNRIRLNGCAIQDVVKYDLGTPVEDQQQEDFIQLGQLILSIAGNANAALNAQKAMDHLTRLYSPRLKEVVTWLLQPVNASVEKNITMLLSGIADEMATTLDAQLHAEDTLTSTLMGELENGRLVRLLSKLGLINERPEYEHNTQWSETGERYYLKLFRDYVFHAIDEQGRPVTDLAHIITSLNKLDAGSSETVNLLSKDEQIVLSVSYKELKKAVETAFNELNRTGRIGR